MANEPADEQKKPSKFKAMMKELGENRQELFMLLLSIFTIGCVGFGLLIAFARLIQQIIGG